MYRNIHVRILAYIYRHVKYGRFDTIYLKYTTVMIKWILLSFQTAFFLPSRDFFLYSIPIMNFLSATNCIYNQMLCLSLRSYVTPS